MCIHFGFFNKKVENIYPAPGKGQSVYFDWIPGVLSKKIKRLISEESLIFKDLKGKGKLY